MIKKYWPYLLTGVAALISLLGAVHGYYVGDFGWAIAVSQAGTFTIACILVASRFHDQLDRHHLASIGDQPKKVAESHDQQEEMLRMRFAGMLALIARHDPAMLGEFGLQLERYGLRPTLEEGFVSTSGDDAPRWLHIGRIAHGTHVAVAHTVAALETRES